MMFTLAFALLAGCTSWIDQEADCEYLVYDWSDDLLGYILQGDGSGSFEFDPIDGPREEISGEYDPSNGDYEYDVSYDDYWLDEAHVEGFGTVFHNGNLDLRHNISYKDVLGDTWSLVNRIQRNECEMRLATWADGAEDDAYTMVGSFEDDETFEWEVEVTDATYIGGWSDDLSEWTFYDDGSYRSESETDAEEGETAYTYSYASGQDTYEGSARFNADGSWVGSVAFGDGTTCTYRADYGQDCTYTCDDGSEFTDYCAS